MPRISTMEYRASHHRLKESLTELPQAMMSLPANEQWLLHSFFVPTRDLSDQELNAHRKVISKEQPSLPHKAGRALTHLNQNCGVAMTAANGDPARMRQLLVQMGGTIAPISRSTRKGRRAIRVNSVLRAEPDATLVAQAVLSLTRRMREE